MRIAVSTEGSEVSAHFGRCDTYTIFDVEDGKVVEKKTVANPGHSPGFLPKYLSEMGVTHIIAGGMGPRAQGFFSQYHIETIVGATGPVDEVIQQFLSENLVVGEDQCDHDHPGHEKCHE
jgi:predicted Fe-Mo cluster-binding NifX family protein